MGIVATFAIKELMKGKKNRMDLSSIFAYILKIAILLMNSHIVVPDEIDEKLKKNHNLLSRQIRKTQTFLILQQIFRLISIFSLMFSLIFYISWIFSRIFSINLLFFALPTFIGVVSFFLYIIIRFIKETIVISREYFLKEKQNLNYLSEEILFYYIFTLPFKRIIYTFSLFIFQITT